MKRSQSLLRLWGIYCFSAWQPFFFIFSWKYRWKTETQGDQCEQRKDDTDGEQITSTGHKISSFSCRCNSSTSFADLELDTLHQCNQNRINGLFVVWDVGISDHRLSEALICSGLCYPQSWHPAKAQGLGQTWLVNVWSKRTVEIHFEDFVFSQEQNLTCVNVITDNSSVNPCMLFLGHEDLLISINSMVIFYPFYQWVNGSLRFWSLLRWTQSLPHSWVSQACGMDSFRGPGIIPARSQCFRLQGLFRRNAHSLLSLEELAMMGTSFSPCCNLLL